MEQVLKYRVWDTQEERDVSEWAMLAPDGRLFLGGTPPPDPARYLVERGIGKLDAAGREIYEGDLVGEPHQYGCVKYGSVDMGFNGWEFNNLTHGPYVDDGYGGDEYLTHLLAGEPPIMILGNIHQNDALARALTGQEGEVV